MPEHFMEVFPAHGCVVGRKIVLRGGSGRGFQCVLQDRPLSGDVLHREKVPEKKLLCFQAVGDPGPGRDLDLGISKSFLMVLKMQQKYFAAVLSLKQFCTNQKQACFSLNEPLVTCLGRSMPTTWVSAGFWGCWVPDMTQLEPPYLGVEQTGLNVLCRCQVRSTALTWGQVRCCGLQVFSVTLPKPQLFVSSPVLADCPGSAFL